VGDDGGRCGSAEERSAGGVPGGGDQQPERVRSRGISSVSPCLTGGFADGGSEAAAALDPWPWWACSTIVSRFDQALAPRNARQVEHEVIMMGEREFAGWRMKLMAAEGSEQPLSSYARLFIWHRGRSNKFSLTFECGEDQQPGCLRGRNVRPPQGTRTASAGDPGASAPFFSFSLLRR
jgi:hypothetical protein